ncbi:uncharacterized protein LOC135689977 isoform X2 [Rhopilema esculentum]|uniref:uncharacterized protein LOC135689977 isoform X2 n=1 Tax=Rhopilema esculentum TaxID=499914 RepID=UPI0031DF157E|eukprot:gene8741-14764_t
MSNSTEAEHIEWDLPVSEMQKMNKDSGPEGWMDFSKLSLGTEMRNKIWEQEHKDVIGPHGKAHIFSSNEPPFSEHTFMNGKLPAEEQAQRSKGHQPGAFNHSSHQIFDFNSTSRNNSSRNGFHIGNSLNPHSPSFLPSHQAQITSPTEEQSQGGVNGRGDNRFSLSGHGGDLRTQFLQSENQVLNRQVIELKAVLQELHALQNGSMPPDGNTHALPDPVFLALQLLKMEQLLHEKTGDNRSLEERLSEQTTEMEKTKKEREFEVTKLKKDLKVLQEKLDNKSKEVEEKMIKKDDKYNYHGKNGLSKLTDELKEDLKKSKEEKEKLLKEVDDLKTQHSHEEALMKIDTHRLEQELKTLKEHVAQSQEDEVRKASEVERMFMAAREAIEKDRQDKYLLLVEQNKLKHKVEKMTESLKSYQIKNDELTRIQNELEQEVDGFRKLKKLIQEHGLPNHDQLIMLQQQAESYKEDVLSERKDRERAQAQREKLRRDYETSQARLASLQEQVYKYQEHILKLNGDRQRLAQQLEAATGVQQNQGNKLMRQLSTPSFMGSKMGFDRALGKNQFSPPNQHQMRPPNSGPLDDLNRGRGGYRNGYNNYGPNRPFGDRRPNSGGPGQFDGWQRQMNAPRPPPGQNQYSLMNKGPRSPLLNPQAEPWRFGNQQNMPQNQPLNSQFGSGFGYGGGIWSQQQAPRSPSGFNNMRMNQPHMWPLTSSEQQHQPGFGSPQMSRAPGMKSGESWSSASDEQPSPPVNPRDENPFSTSPTTSSTSSQESNNNHEGFICRKCDSKCPDGDAFRAHVEKCFNS